MAPRRYRMDRRAESAEETRRRIVRATYELHAEQGIAATSVRDIAERADVAVGSVYHHFPSYDDVIRACGAYTVSLTQPPGAEVLSGIATPAARLHAVVDALFSFYRRFPGFERVRADRDKFAPLEEFVRADEENRRSLLAAALHPRAIDGPALAIAFALLDVAVYRALCASRLSHAAAVREIVNLLERSLLDPGGARASTRTRAAPGRTGARALQIRSTRKKDPK